MIPTFFAALLAALALPILLRGTVWDAMRLVLASTLLGGSAVVLLSSGSSIPPPVPALLVLLFKIWQERAALSEAFRITASAASRSMLFFSFYGVIGAVLLPRIFAHAMLVAPMQPLKTGGLFAVAPLAFTSQNINAAVYLLFTAAALVAGAIVARSGVDARAFARFSAILTLIHAGWGWYDVITRGTPAWAIIDVVRNANYAMLTQGAGLLPRMSGIFPEPSAFASYGFTWFVFCTELWMRRVEPRLTGTAAAVMTLSLIVSTSSSAYLGLGAYAVVLAVRTIYFRSGLRGQSLSLVVFVLLSGVAAVLALAIFVPAIAHALGTILTDMTAGKADSDSGLQRGFWARQGIDAFLASAGLGVGPGSFRSSSIATAILGSVGVPGTLAFLVLLAALFRATVSASQRSAEHVDAAVGSALGCTALMMLLPAAAGSATPDPGILWGVIAGAALGFATRNLAGDDQSRAALPIFQRMARA